MSRDAKGRKRDWAGLDPRAVKEILADLISQPDIVRQKSADRPVCS